MKLYARIVGGPQSVSPQKFVVLRAERRSLDEPNGLVLGFPFIDTRQEAHKLRMDMKECMDVLESFILEDLPEMPNRGVDPAFEPILNSICPVINTYKGVDREA